MTALAAPRLARAATLTDAAGRVVPIPEKVARVFPAGPPAAILLYTLAPDLLLGWPRANRPEECEFLLPDICARPEIGRLTGRGNTANLEVVLALKPDLILDVGSTNPTFVSLADRVQEQTGIPYALLDGRFDAIAPTYRKLGELTAPPGRRPRRWRAMPMTRIDDDHAARRKYPDEPATAGLLRARAARAGDRARRLDQRRDHRFPRRARNVAGERRAGWRMSRSSRCCCWNPDVIVTIDRDFAANVRSDPVWASVAAVQRRRVHLSPKCRSAGSTSRPRSTG